MNEEQKKQYKERYANAKQQGVKFWPDIIFKDLLIAFMLFVVLVLLATFIGVAQDAKADPADANYVPRPEWYFLFLFKFLAIYGQIPGVGTIEWIATTIVPIIAIGLLFLMPFIDRSPARHQSKRTLPLMIMAFTVVCMIALTLIADVPTADISQPVYIPGILQAILGLILPAVTLVLLILFYFLLKSKGRIAMLWTTGISSLLMIALTVATLVLAPAKTTSEETTIAGSLSEQILVGQDLYSVHCAECHGAEGEGGEVKGVEGFDGVILDPLANTDVMYTYTDEALLNVISYGQQESDPAMTPFGRAYGGELGPGDIDAIVTFMRYTWDNRVEMPLDVLAASAMPTLAEGEVPSYEVHIAAIVKRYCVSCHREGKNNQNYLMTSYGEIIETGDNAPNLIAGDLTCNTMQMLNRVEGLEVGNPMPPTKELKPELVAIWEAWILAGMPNTAAEAAALSAPAAVEEATPAP